MSLEEQHDSKSEFKRKRSESPVSTSTTREHADLSGGPSHEYRNKRVKTERPASPAPSFMSSKSDLSVAPPDEFKGVMFPLDFRVRPCSPTPSYLSLRTDMSIDAPNNFKREETFNVVTRVGSERAPSPTLSYVSELTECFVEQPTNKTEATYHLPPRLLTENHMKCPVCKSILKDPVSIPCGHNFCRDCINASWDSCVEDYVCPQCGRGSKVRPELNTNTALAEVVKHLQQAGFSPALPTCSYAGPEDVACDFCSDQRLKAVKTCSTCCVSLCETHIRDHYTIAALQKHTLSDVTGAMEKKLSMQNPPTDLSSICGEQEKDRSISDSGLNTSMEKEAAGTSTPETDVKKDVANATNFELMHYKLQQEILGLKKSFSKFKKHNAKKDKHVEDYDKVDYGWDGSDDDESSDEEESDNSYEEEEDSYDMYKTDESKSENDNEDDDQYNDDYDEDKHDDEYDEDEHDEYNEDEDDYEYNEDEDNYECDEDEDSNNSDEDDVDEYGY